MNHVVHFELPAENIDRAKEFYTSVFDWQIEESPFEDGVYTSAITSPIDENHMHEKAGAINGALVDRDGPNHAPVITIEVPSIDDHVATIEEAGGAVIVEKGEVPDTGYFAYFEDPEGNVVGLWETME